MKLPVKVSLTLQISFITIWYNISEIWPLK
jgi:hypothetical protein